MAPPPRHRARARSAVTELGLETADDATLMASLASHPDRALAEAYQRHSQAVMALAQRLLVTRAMAEEVTQEVFLRIWMRPERFDPARGSLLTFLLADCHGRSIDRIRSESSRRAREHDDLAREQRQRSDEPDMTADLCAAEDAAQIAAAMDSLCDGERDAIWLAYYGDNSYRAVAELLQVPEGTVKARIRRGLGRLRSELSRPGGLPSPRPM